MNIGYARVSTEDQNLAMQQQALKAAGCTRIFEDHGISGASPDRPGLAAALAAVRPGDVLVVWKLDRLGRSLPHLVEVINGLRRDGVGFRCVQEQIDTTSAGGRFYLHILAALAEFEREMISERTRAGMAAARRNGARLGRPPKITAAQLDEARVLIDTGQETRTAAAARLGIHPNTLRRALRNDVV